MIMIPQFTIESACKAYLDIVAHARSKNTLRTYETGLTKFLDVLRKNNIQPDKTLVNELTEESLILLISELKVYSPATERLYLTAVTGFFEYLSAGNTGNISLPRIRLLIRQRARRPGVRLPQFPRDAIEELLKYIEELKTAETKNPGERLRNLRDRAFLITLADTGLRVHEACALRRGDIDWNEGRALVIGKGNRQAVVRFSKRAQNALRDYLNARSKLDGVSGRPLSALPLFARHDKGSGKKIKQITTTTGRNIVKARVLEKLGEENGNKITPHSFRHYFVTRVLHASGNLKLAQELARHQNIAVTQRYAHLSDNELDKGYWEVFEER